MTEEAISKRLLRGRVKAKFSDKYEYQQKAIEDLGRFGMNPFGLEGGRLFGDRYTVMQA